MLSQNIDPVTYEVVRNALKSVVNEMNLSLSRSAHSAIITEGNDHCGAIFDTDGNLVMQGDTDLPIFVGIIEFPCRTIVQQFSTEGFSPGDVVMTNSAFAGGSHINDMILVRPVFYEEELVCFTLAIGHWTDVGGSEPGSIVPQALEYFAEGILYPPIKVVEAGVINRAVVDIILANTRIPEETRGDLEAQIASLEIGEQRILQLIQKYSIERIEFYMHQIIEDTESLMHTKIEELEDGVYTFTDYSDVVSNTNPDPITVKLALKVAGSKLVFDFSGSSPQSPSSSNCTLGITASGVFVVTRGMFPDVPMNHGCFKAIEIIAPPGTVVNAQPPAAISGAFSTILEKVIGAALGAFSQVLPERVIACPYNMVNISLGGVDPRYGRSYVMYIYSEGGLGARFSKDGVSGVVSLFGGSTRFPPVEVLEKRFPILFTEWVFETDSGGPGKYRGGVGSIKRFKIVADRAQLMVLGDREKFPPFGLFGGKSGKNQRLELRKTKGERVGLSVKTSKLTVERGDEVVFYSSGGGGLGDPLERLPEAVLDDVRQGYVSKEAANTEYGVVIEGPPWRVDSSATKRVRKSRRSYGTDR